MNGPALDALLADLLDAYPRAKISQGTLAVYRAHLSDLNGRHAAAAVSDLIRTREFFPSIAEIREAVAERTLILPTAEEALTYATGFTPRESIPSEVRKTIAEMGGRSSFRLSDRPGVWRRQFLDLYEARRSRLIREAQVKTLPPAPERNVIE